MNSSLCFDLYVSVVLGLLSGAVVWILIEISGGESFSDRIDRLEKIHGFNLENE